MEQHACLTLTDVVLNPENLAVVTGVSIVMVTVTRAVPELVATTWWARVRPLLPPLMCIAALWLPGVADAQMQTGDRALLGLLLGVFAGQVHKILNQAPSRKR
jgi:hypothetical protein